jgi:hypothetical protein
MRKPEVSEGKLLAHNRKMMEAMLFAKTAKAIDSENFYSSDFLLLLKLRGLFLSGVEEYQKISESVELLKVAIAAKISFISLDQTELRYRSSKQQEFYNFVAEELQKKQVDRIVFRQKIDEKLTEILPKIKTREGKMALHSYNKDLNTISQHTLGLKLLARFKNNQFDDYYVLQNIGNIVDDLARENLQDLNYLTSVVTSNYSTFENLGQVIEIDNKHRSPDTYAKIIQYIALNQKYQYSFEKLKELIELMRRWYSPYQAILAIRKAHPPSEYRQPQEFQQPIPGEEIYLKYKKWLTDTNTGRSYIDFPAEQ